MKAIHIIINNALVAGMLAIMIACNTNQSNEAVNSYDSVEDVRKAGSTALASPRAQVHGHIGGVEITVDYGSPQVKGRKIWGGLEPYGAVWRAGANETTSFKFDGDVIINGELIKAGKYGFYLIPYEKKKWIAIINTDWDREEHGAWGAYNYNRENDVVRLKVQPQWADQTQERLTYDITNNAIRLAWEKARILIPVKPAG